MTKRRLPLFKKMMLTSTSEQSLAIALQRKALDMVKVLTIAARQLGISIETGK